ncbi:MAG: YihY/virulence factor BrkB family protein [Oscillospiraceae bacterium]|nr:YihY/virulence factor BrkB family protein [Oscillospiraceae bacterium]
MGEQKAKGGILTGIRELVEIYVNNRVSRSAAELSYFLTLSIFPTLICVHAMLAWFLPGITVTIDALEGFIPSETLDIISDYLQYVTTHSNDALLTAGIIGMATTSAAAFRSIHSIMGDIQGAARYRGIFALLFSFVFSLIFMAAIYFSIIVMITGNWIFTYIVDVFPIVAGLQLWNLLKFPIMLVIFVLIIYGLYRITAPADIHSTILPGALVASVILVLVSVLFSWFISMFTKYPLIYGSLASIIVFMLWIYICGQILIMGNALNVVMRRHKPENPKSGITKHKKRLI